MISEDQDIDLIIENLKNFKGITQSQVKFIVEKATSIFAQQTNVQFVTAPVTVCGDVHGQLHDLIQLFKIGGDVPFTNYLFLGDYVDRGYYSVQTLALLVSLKARYPSRITLTRGNHETRRITQVYGFYDQCIRKYGSQNVWKLFTNMFDYIPLTACIQNQIFSLHGGLSPSVKSLNQINNLPRIAQVPDQGAACDFVWSDPDQNNGYKESPRGAGFTFGSDITEQFTHTNNLKMIARAHQLMDKGYKLQHNDKITTIFSAPNYCYRCGNQAAILEMDENMNQNYIQFDPYPLRGHKQITKKTPQYFL